MQNPLNLMTVEFDDLTDLVNIVSICIGIRQIRK